MNEDEAIDKIMPKLIQCVKIWYETDEDSTHAQFKILTPQNDKILIDFVKVKSFAE